MRILLIEDQTLLATTMMKALNEYEDIEVVAYSTEANQALSLCAEYNPDIVLMDVYTKNGNGIEVTKKLKQHYPKVKVFLMTGIDRDHLIEDAKIAGADIFVWKDLSLHDLVKFIRAADQPYRIFPDPALKRKESLLSATDLKILDLMAKGLTTQEIAEDLFLSYGTVRLYISKMYQATGLKNRAQLVNYAIKLGLIDPD